MMGLPSTDEWPPESPIPREAFESCTQSVITLERLIRFEDRCAFQLLRVSQSIGLILNKTIPIHILFSHSYPSSKVFVHRHFKL